MRNKKAQAWGMDLMVAAAIFTIGIVSFYFYTINNPGQAKDTTELLFYEGNFVSGTILSEGSPPNWNPTNVQKIGILSDGKINNTKLQYFYELSESDYRGTKGLFEMGYNYNYYFTLEDDTFATTPPVAGIGEDDHSFADNLIKITRYAVYNDEPRTVYLYIFD